MCTTVGLQHKYEEAIKGAQRLVCSADTPDQDALVDQQRPVCSADAPRLSSSIIGSEQNFIQARMCSVCSRRAGSRFPEQAEFSCALA